MSYKLIETDSSKFEEFYKDNSLTFEGVAIDNQNLNFLDRWLHVEVEIDPSEDYEDYQFYNFQGQEMNTYYNLTGENQYPNDLNFLVIPLKTLDPNKIAKLAMARFELGGRWFNDIVDNNSRRE